MEICGAGLVRLMSVGTDGRHVRWRRMDVYRGQLVRALVQIPCRNGIFFRVLYTALWSALYRMRGVVGGAALSSV